jgi:hypothetical protein
MKAGTALFIWSADGVLIHDVTFFPVLIDIRSGMTRIP